MIVFTENEENDGCSVVVQERSFWETGLNYKEWDSNVVPVKLGGD